MNNSFLKLLPRVFTTFYKQVVLKNGPTPASFLFIFVLFKHKIYRKNVSKLFEKVFIRAIVLHDLSTRVLPL